MNNYAHRLQTTQTKGAAALIALLFFLAGSLAIVGSVSAPIIKDLRLIRGLEQSKQSYALADGLSEDIVYRIKTGRFVSDTETLTEGNAIANAAIISSGDEAEIYTIGDANNRIRKISIGLIEGDGAAFAYGVQADVGGIILENNATVRGNVYANGPITGSGKNDIWGDAISAGPDGLIRNIHATGTAYANAIEDAIIDGDAFYDSIFTGSTAGGTEYPGSADQATTSLSIIDEQIEKWESNATSTIIADPCPYAINEDVTLGPVKIECDVAITGSPTVTLAGPVWITGNLSIQNNPIIQVAPGLEDKSVPIIVDDPANQLTGSQVTISNSPIFQGAVGSNKSYVLIVSQNRSAENGGSEVAINIQNFATGDLLIFAGHGEILMQNNVFLREVSAYRIRLTNFAEVIYEKGLGNLLFQSGPTGGFEITSWGEAE